MDELKLLTGYQDTQISASQARILVFDAGAHPMQEQAQVILFTSLDRYTKSKIPDFKGLLSGLSVLHIQRFVIVMVNISSM